MTVCIETHISRVLLHGERAYKVKKPLRLPFLDFSSPERRRWFGQEELRLNRRTAPEIYLGLRPLSVDWATFCADPEAALDASHADTALDWVLCMHRFDADALLAEQARCGRLQPELIDALAAHVAGFHQSLPPLPPEALPQRDTLHWAQECVQALQQQPGLAPPQRAEVQALGAALLAQLQARRPWMQQRATQGFARECHGDLHLGNLIEWEGGVRAFDALEFEPDLRAIDVLSDATFAFMDLLQYRQPELAWRFLNGYLDITGDFEGLRGLRAWAAYRALVRARVAWLNSASNGSEAGGKGSGEGMGDADAQALALHERYCACAQALLAAPAPPGLWLLMGLSGSGKSTVAQMLRDALVQQGRAALCLRSDLERKRLLGVAATARPSAAQQAHWYSPALTQQTYARLQQAAQQGLQAGCSVLIDAASLRRHERQALRALAAQQQVPFYLWECRAGSTQAQRRLAVRQADNRDPSDADAAVRALQAGFFEPIDASEQAGHRLLHNDGDLAALQAQVRAALHEDESR
ncbi:AAA family ATPase [Serpentinimonas barnesii]|uniref:bifunctional aminoglycoside phosphotransferase/ATP-binding protein n=1 Tax=Serpentinimonas barnesii TaxID=1458427 RepID=UPI000694B7E5|nr:bifunctional aminoglycoside phosphotransferase/ATP-binding protein [Serpentinimonas barnesii]